MRNRKMTSQQLSKKKLSCLPTKTIRAILADPFCRGINGADYGPRKEELEAILWQRMNKEENNDMAKMEKEADKEKKRLKGLIEAARKLFPLLPESDRKFLALRIGQEVKAFTGNCPF